jgi:hypothetical protein
MKPVYRLDFIGLMSYTFSCACGEEIKADFEKTKI